MASINKLWCLSLLGFFVALGNAEWDSSLYASSDSFYPSPKISGSGGWEESLSKAQTWVSNLTLAEKVGLVTGSSGPCAGNIAPIERIGFGGLCLQDGPAAIRQALYASVFPAGIAAGASWDRGLINARGRYLGEEFRAKGSHIALAPVAGPLGRSPFGGRNWEGFATDPYLSGVAMEETVLGLQAAGVQATSKHYIGNEQETQRNPTTVNGTTIKSISSNIDDRTLHELYLWPFANAVRAGSASIMCSYNRLNQTYGCENSHTLNNLLKTELGFQGYVMSDWGATHSGVAAIEAGQDMDMPGTISFGDLSSGSFFGANITSAVNNRTLDVARLDDMVLRILTPYFHLHQDENFPPVDETTGSLNFFGAREADKIFKQGPLVDARGEGHADLIRELGAAGTVLLKNENNALPLSSPKNLAIFGNDASDASQGLYYFALFDAFSFPEFGTFAVGGGSGAGRFSYIVSPLEALKAQGQADSTLVQYILDNKYITKAGLESLAPVPDTCLVFLKSWATEGFDRLSLIAESNSTAVVAAVTSVCNNTIVVVHGPGPVIMPWADNPNVTAILAAHYPGEQTGNSIVDVLYGKTNPSGHLPYTIAKNADDYAYNLVNSSALLASTDPNAWQADFTEGQLTDYREFDAFNKSVAYEFGFGLSYTSFSLADLAVTYTFTSPLARTPSPATPIVPGGNAELWDVIASVSVTVANTGSVGGQTVPQLYISMPASVGAGTPVRVLRGFDKVMLEVGESKTVEFELMRRDLSYWDVVAQQWTLPSESIGVSVGFSSRDLVVSGSLTV
ncbi:avenacinase [Pseudovirgaria hyperparasitica]|uniref:Probable beta-glucosidase G n=1 Tax=Pseudovirgaria hyperparasitica TaxID=470096 RepID=A0A6A6W872_9PEZI|nr:avenacinase [Pseudovirgaria hyperparasitica]KAF2759088.1 avenacinase [Pseudovirgaria hyperparasitica]